MVVATVQPLADARGSYDAARAAAVRGCERTRGYPRNVSGFFQVRAATVRERMVVATVQPLAYARGSYDAARIGGWWLATRIANTRWGQGSRRGWRGSSRRKGPHSPTSRRRPPPRTATRSTECARRCAP